jgi:hypothetical protein
MRLDHSLLIGIAFLSMVVAGGCELNPNGESSRHADHQLRPSISEIIEARGRDYLEIEGVMVFFEAKTATGEPCIKIGVEELTDAIRERLPDEIDGWPVQLFESGVPDRAARD